MTLGKINIRTKGSRANESPINANYRGVGLSEMIESIKKKKKHRCNGNLSLHVLNIIEGIHISARTKKTYLLKTSCEKPKRFSNKEIKNITR